MRKSLKILGGVIGTLSIIGASTLPLYYLSSKSSSTYSSISAKKSSSLIKPTILASTSNSSNPSLSGNGMVWNLNTGLLNQVLLGSTTISPWQNGSITNSNSIADMSNLQVPYEGQNVSLKMMSASWLVKNLTNDMLSSLLEQSIGILDSSFANQSGYLSVSNIQITQVQDNELSALSQYQSSLPSYTNTSMENEIIDSSAPNNVTNVLGLAQYKGYTSYFDNAVNITFNTTWNNQTLENQFNNSNISQYFNFNNLTINDLAIDASNASNALWDNIKNDTIDVNITNDNPSFIQSLYQFQGWLYNSNNITYNYNPSSQANTPSNIEQSAWWDISNILFQQANVLDNLSNNPIVPYVLPLMQWNQTNANEANITTSSSTMANYLPSYFVFGNGYYQAPYSTNGITMNNGLLNIANKNNYEVYAESLSAGNAFVPLKLSISNIDDYKSIEYTATSITSNNSSILCTPL